MQEQNKFRYIYNGKEVDRVVGLKDNDALKTFIKKAL